MKVSWAAWCSFGSFDAWCATRLLGVLLICTTWESHISFICMIPQRKRLQSSSKGKWRLFRQLTSLSKMKLSISDLKTSYWRMRWMQWKILQMTNWCTAMSSFGMRETGVSTQTIELISLCYLIITMSANRIITSQRVILRMRYRNGLTTLKSTALILIIFMAQTVTFITDSTVASLRHLVCSKIMQMYLKFKVTR